VRKGDFNGESCIRVDVVVNSKRNTAPSESERKGATIYSEDHIYHVI
jgi:hypothetical protein